MTVRSRITIKDADQRTMLRNKLSDRVLDMLMEMIMSGELKMGEQLKTEDLANQLGVSRMPIREALKELEKKGLAETIPYIGTKLVKLTGEDVRQ
ncbi:MAG: winged helix-turn-helix domain-containing protein, partial [Lachnospiraceae bacterium]|nr:winged helix-turn-helix domain-containing protein [Lachnospiraceae bacterium]